MPNHGQMRVVTVFKNNDGKMEDGMKNSKPLLYALPAFCLHHLSEVKRFGGIKTKDHFEGKFYLYKTKVLLDSMD